MRGVFIFTVLTNNSPYIVQSFIGIRVVKILKIVLVNALVFLPVRVCPCCDSGRPIRIGGGGG